METSVLQLLVCLLMGRFFIPPQQDVSALQYGFVTAFSFMKYVQIKFQFRKK